MTKCTYVAGDTEDGCKFCYIEQPCENTGCGNDDCNPYKAPHVVLQCKITVPLGIELQIKWFCSPTSSNTNSSLITADNLKYDITVQKIQNGDVFQQTSRLVITDIDERDYWCQVFHENNALLKSQILEISNGYDRDQPCSDNVLLSQEVKKCADVIEGVLTCPTGVGMMTSSSLIQTSISFPTTSTLSTLFITSQTSSFPSFLYPSSSKQRSTITTQEISENLRPTSESLIENKSNNFRIWLYIVAGLSGLFALLIILLTIICVGLCLMRPTNGKGMVTDTNEQRIESISPDATEPPSRPVTSMTIQTDILLNPFPVHDSTLVYDTLDQDYEDIDEGKEDEVLPALPSIINHPRYHEQGPSAVSIHNTHSLPMVQSQYSDLTSPNTHSLPMVQPQYSDLTSTGNPNTHSSPMVQPQYSDLTSTGNPNEVYHLNQAKISQQMTGYGKLDHSRPRQNYYPKKESPLLSGYRKLDHNFRSTTLPQGVKSPGYTNIEVSGSGSHLRSISLPSSEYSNLNTHSQPSTPTNESPGHQRRYANFEIIEAYEGESYGDHMESDDYHMLADATVDETTAGQYMKEEYEFLPVCTCDDDEDEGQSLNSLNTLPQEFGKVSRKRGLHSLGRDLLEEKISVTSSQSSDFTGPFFFPHMGDFGESTSPEPDRHLYKALDISRMEPKQSYAMINIKGRSDI